MINDSIAVLIQLRHDNRRTACIAKIKREGGRMFGLPFLPSQEMQPFRPRMFELHEDNLELMPYNGAGLPLYSNRGVVIVP